MGKIVLIQKTPSGLVDRFCSSFSIRFILLRLDSFRFRFHALNSRVSLNSNLKTFISFDLFILLTQKKEVYYFLKIEE